jgi:hypothetical protein
LSQVAARVGDSDELALAYANATRSIGSDSWASEALMQLASEAALSADGWQMLLQAARDIGSDSYCAALLIAVANKLPRDEETLAAYRATLDTVGSDAYYRQASQALDSAAR